MIPGFPRSDWKQLCHNHSATNNEITVQLVLELRRKAERGLLDRLKGRDSRFNFQGDLGIGRGPSLQFYSFT